MTRQRNSVAALWVFDFPLQAMLRARPEEGDDLVIIDGQTISGGARILVASQSARAAGVRAGLTVAQARGLHPDLRVALRDATVELSAAAALVDVGRSFSPRIEVDVDPAWLYLDASGLDRLIGPADAVARSLARAAAAVGLAVCVGMARSKTLARIAARTGEGQLVIPAERRAERRLIARLPLEVLEPSGELLAMLHRFGLRTIGDFVALPRREIADRLGPEGTRLSLRARGEEEAGGLCPTPTPIRFVEEQSLDYGIDNLEPLAFVLRGVLDRVVRRLSLSGFLANCIRLSLDYEGAGSFERLVEISAPSRDVPSLLALCRLSLAKDPPEQPITRVSVEVTPSVSRQRQLSLFEPAGPAPDRLAVTVARLQALCGSERVGVPRPTDSFEDDAFSLEELRVGAEVAETSLPEAPTVALRRFRPPHEVDVIWRNGAPVRVEGREVNGRIVEVRGPFRRNEGWWSTQERGDVDIYDVQLEGGIAYRLAHVREAQQWLAHGWYD